MLFVSAQKAGLRSFRPARPVFLRLVKKKFLFFPGMVRDAMNWFKSQQDGDHPTPSLPSHLPVPTPIHTGRARPLPRLIVEATPNLQPLATCHSMITSLVFRQSRSLFETRLPQPSWRYTPFHSFFGFRHTQKTTKNNKKSAPGKKEARTTSQRLSHATPNSFTTSPGTP